MNICIKCDLQSYKLREVSARHASKKSSPQCLFLTGKSCSAGVGVGIDGPADHPLVDLELADLAGADALHQSRVERWEAGGSLSRREL